MKRILLSTALVVLSVSSSYAQFGFGAGSQRIQRPLNRPTVSPYINLLRGGGTGLNYYGLVRPEQQLFGSTQQLQFGLGALRQGRGGRQSGLLFPGSGLSTTGHAVVFDSYRQTAGGGVGFGGGGFGLGGGLGGGGFGGGGLGFSGGGGLSGGGFSAGGFGGGGGLGLRGSGFSPLSGGGLSAGGFGGGQGFAGGNAGAPGGAAQGGGALQGGAAGGGSSFTRASGNPATATGANQNVVLPTGHPAIFNSYRSGAGAGQ